MYDTRLTNYDLLDSATNVAPAYKKPTHPFVEEEASFLEHVHVYEKKNLVKNLDEI
jgi:hypothetical protein